MDVHHKTLDLASNVSQNYKFNINFNTKTTAFVSKKSAMDIKIFSYLITSSLNL